MKAESCCHQINPSSSTDIWLSWTSHVVDHCKNESHSGACSCTVETVHPTQNPVTSVGSLPQFISHQNLSTKLIKPPKSVNAWTWRLPTCLQVQRDPSLIDVRRVALGPDPPDRSAVYLLLRRRRHVRPGRAASTGDRRDWETERGRGSAPQRQCTRPERRCGRGRKDGNKDDENK